jgi:deazaflavin-dependent oxidoreductase (nitroreductase family)
MAFRHANRWFVVPLHRAGLAVWLCSPLAGWQCLLTTIGRTSGLRRDTPLGYIVMDGAAWVMAGYGPRTQWYRNILAEPRVDLRLPGRRPFIALAEEVRDPDLRARVIPPLCRSMALPGAMIGCVPATSTDERILDCVSWVPLLCIRPADGSALLPGTEDPGGRGWIWRHVAMTAITAGLLALLRRLPRV